MQIQLSLLVECFNFCIFYTSIKACDIFTTAYLTFRIRMLQMAKISGQIFPHNAETN